MNQKSNLPDFKELVGFAGKFMRDLKKSVGEIIEEYQKARKDTDTKAAGEASVSTDTEKPETGTESSAKKTNTTAASEPPVSPTIEKPETSTESTAKKTNTTAAGEAPVSPTIEKPETGTESTAFESKSGTKSRTTRKNRAPNDS